MRGWGMKQRRIDVDAVEMASRQIECEKILPLHLATAVNARHFDKARRLVEAGRLMTSTNCSARASWACGTGWPGIRTGAIPSV